MGLTRTLAPTDPVVTLAEVRAHVRMDAMDDDAVLTLLAEAAVAHLDGYQGVLGLCLADQEWELSYDAFPSGPIKLPLGPVIEVVSVTYTDAVGVPQTFAPINYEVDTSSGDGWVVPVSAWPTTGSYLNAARVRFRAGHSPAGAVPDALRVAVLMLVSHWYNNREGQGQLPAAVDALITPYKRNWIG